MGIAYLERRIAEQTETKVSHLIVETLRDAGVRHVFGISGGASLHIIHAIADTPGIKLICPQGECSGGYAADACARLNGIGCALATSGPGATNLVTAIAASYYDSVPVVYLTGNQTTDRMNTYGTRQYGFQATPITEVVAPICKGAFLISSASTAIATLRKAIYLAQSGRKGPVLVDIPDDIQRAAA